MSIQYHNIYHVNAITEVQVKPTRKGRSYLLIENRSAAPVWVNFDTHPDSINGIEIAAGGNYERERAVPQNYIFVIGQMASPTLQTINVTEGFDE